MWKFIATHFKRGHSGNTVLVTFQNLNFLIRIIRKPTEWIRVLVFPDKNLLSFGDLVLVCDQYGIKLHQSINWSIGLTQGYLVYRKS